MAVTRSVSEGKKFEGLDYVRSFPGVYLGTFILETALREVIENAVDEARRKQHAPEKDKRFYADTVDIIVHGDREFEIRDNGRGMPVDFQEEDQLNGIVFFLGNIMSGSNFDADTKGTTTGTHGIGASATNAISKRFDVTTFTGGKAYHQAFRQGRAGRFAHGTEFLPDDSFTEAGNERLTPLDPKLFPGAPKHGTWVRFVFDDAVETGGDLNFDMIVQRAMLSACLTEDLTITIHRPGEDPQVFGPTNGGAASVLALRNPQAAVLADFQAEFTFEKTAAGSDGEKITRPGTIDVALQLSAEPEKLSAVNSVLTPNGGSHANGVDRGMIAALQGRRVRDIGLRKGEDHPEPEDFLAVVSQVVSATTPEPGFSGQDKLSVGNKAFGNAIQRAVNQMLTTWLVQPVNREALKQWATQALLHARSRRKIEAERARSKRQRKENTNGLTTSMSMPEGLVPCQVSGYDSGAELFIVEGLSARGTAEGSRDAVYQAAYAIRGKSLNSFAGDLDKVMSNKEIREIVTVLGTGMGDACKPEDCNYSAIFLAADADPDGYHITGLLMVLFYTQFYPLIEAGMVYIPDTPLHVITVGKGKQLRKIYALDDEERDEKVAELKAAGETHIEVQRCKGLGEMDVADFNMVMNPATRSVRQILPGDGDWEALELAYSKSKDMAERRRQWVLEGIDSGMVDEDLLN